MPLLDIDRRMIPRVSFVYLFKPLPQALKETDGRQTGFRYVHGIERHSFEDEDAHLELFSKLLCNVERDATVDALHEGLANIYIWNPSEPYDICSPFGDIRQNRFLAIWIFDILNDMLIQINSAHRAQIPLSALRSRSITSNDLEILGPPAPPVRQPRIDSGTPCWKPQYQVDPRTRSFLHRVLRDFNHSWRHVLRSDYNTMTLHALARAIIRLSILDFDVETEGLQYRIMDGIVYSTDLPGWKPFTTSLHRVGDVHVVICHLIEDGLSMAMKHAITSRLSIASETDDHAQERPDYMILSVKHIMLCRAIGSEHLAHTAPLPLLNGNGLYVQPNYDDAEGPSDTALDCFLWATAPARPSVITILQSLPIEVQDIVLSYTCANSVAAAKLGCLIGLGSPFLWKDGPSAIELRTVVQGPPKSLITFDESGFKVTAGIVYKVNAPTDA